MNTRLFIILSCIGLLFCYCKKDNRSEPPTVVKYQISKIVGSNTHLSYQYDTAGALIRVDGKDRDKSLTCNILYDKDVVYLDYHNRTANEKWWVTLTIDPETGYIQTYDDGMYLVTFLYDSTRFADKKSRVVGSYYHGGRFAGDTLCAQMEYDALGNLLSCVFKGEHRQFMYDLKDTVAYNVTTFFSDVALGRLERVIPYLPYTLGPQQKYLVHTMVKSFAYYTNYNYEVDEHKRVTTVYENAAGTNYEYPQ